jgi:putative FmdB family regulatory protein
MPLYDYVCRACGRLFEALVRGSDTPACPACASTDLERQMSLFAVSSQATRQSSLTSARRDNLKVAREKAVAQQEYEKKHAH